MKTRSIAAAVALVATAFAATTFVALEGRGVAVLHTKTGDGSERRTRVWYAEDGGALWIESATDTRPFYRDLGAHPELEVELFSSGLDREPRRLRGQAELVGEPGGHERIRRLLRERYGWADAWVALLQDTSASRAVRVVPADGESLAPHRR